MIGVGFEMDRNKGPSEEGLPGKEADITCPLSQGLLVPVRGSGWLHWGGQRERAQKIFPGRNGK